MHPCIGKPNGLSLSYPSMCHKKSGPCLSQLINQQKCLLAPYFGILCVLTCVSFFLLLLWDQLQQTTSSQRLYRVHVEK